MSKRQHDCRLDGHEFVMVSKPRELVRIRQCKHCPREQRRVQTASRKKGYALAWW